LIRYKDPFQYELSPQTLEKGMHWLTLRLKNEGNDILRDLDIMLHCRDSLLISFRDPHDFIAVLRPDEEKSLFFQVDASGTTDLYVSINGGHNIHSSYYYYVTFL
jgi:hypothetical protein